MDYKGQKLAEDLYYYLIIIFGAIAWVAGYVHADFMITLYGWGAGVALSLVLCVPDWPFFNRHPTKWLDQLPGRSGYMRVGAQARGAEDAAAGGPQDTAAALAKKKDP